MLSNSKAAPDYVKHKIHYRYYYTAIKTTRNRVRVCSRVRDENLEENREATNHGGASQSGNIHAVDSIQSWPT